MSAQEPELRDLVAAELSAHLEEQGLTNPWSTAPGANTRAIYARDLDVDRERYPPDRVRFQRDLADRLLRSTPASLGGTLSIVFTAGLPGAGKSSVIDADVRWRTFRQLDADVFKDELLLRARDDGLLLRQLAARFSDDRPVLLRELSAFVHAESTAVFELARDRCLDRNENLVIHGTLTDGWAVTPVLDRIARLDKQYERIEIVYVTASRARAVEGALRRWWRLREEDPELGGRFVSPAGYDRYFASDGRAKSEAVVEQLAQRARNDGYAVDVHRLEAD